MAKTRAGKARTKTEGNEKRAAARRRAAPARRTVATSAARRRPAKRVASVSGQEAMMAAWQKAMTPAAGHQRLAPLIGSWHAKTTFKMSPDAPATTSDGTSEHRWVLGGRFVEQVFRGTPMGMPFEGLGYTGFDNVQNKYVGIWMDTFSTGIMHSVGIGTPTDRVLESEATAVEPSGTRVSFRCKVEIQDPDHHTYETWTKAPDGRRYCNMRVEYTRRQDT